MASVSGLLHVRLRSASGCLAVPAASLTAKFRLLPWREEQTTSGAHADADGNATWADDDDGNLVVLAQLAATENAAPRLHVELRSRELYVYERSLGQATVDAAALVAAPGRRETLSISLEAAGDDARAVIVVDVEFVAGTTTAPEALERTESQGSLNEGRRHQHLFRLTSYTRPTCLRFGVLDLLQERADFAAREAYVAARAYHRAVAAVARTKQVEDSGAVPYAAPATPRFFDDAENAALRDAGAFSIEITRSHIQRATDAANAISRAYADYETFMSWDEPLKTGAAFVAFVGCCVFVDAEGDPRAGELDLAFRRADEEHLGGGAARYRPLAYVKVAVCAGRSVDAAARDEKRTEKPTPGDVYVVASFRHYRAAPAPQPPAVPRSNSRDAATRSPKKAREPERVVEPAAREGRGRRVLARRRALPGRRGPRRRRRRENDGGDGAEPPDDGGDDAASEDDEPRRLYDEHVLGYTGTAAKTCEPRWHGALGATLSHRAAGPPALLSRSWDRASAAARPTPRAAGWHDLELSDDESDAEAPPDVPYAKKKREPPALHLRLQLALRDTPAPNPDGGRRRGRGHAGPGRRGPGGAPDLRSRVVGVARDGLRPLSTAVTAHEYLAWAQNALGRYLDVMESMKNLVNWTHPERRGSSSSAF
ncbi:hypothetical protein JL720_4300 [Aureococcus anophagefferens]|nr:hypothetical protein JL720_4300 [Aureococcus anophagefferens]